MIVLRFSESPSSNKNSYSNIKSLIGDWKRVIIRFAFVPLVSEVPLKIKKMNFIFDIGLRGAKLENQFTFVFVPDIKFG